MRKAGGIIALIAGIFSVFAAGITLFFGGLGSALDVEDSSTVIAFGWGGVLFSFLTIILGAICMNAKSRIPGLILIITAISGAVLSGAFVAMFMVLALVGGILAVLGKAEGTGA